MPIQRQSPDPLLLHGTLAWVRTASSDGHWTIADIMAREIEPRCAGALELLTSDNTTLESLAQAKLLFKALRVEGETREDRHLGAMLYAAAIAAALVRFGERITRQHDATLRRAFMRIEAEADLPEPMRLIASRALELIRPEI